MVQYKLTYFDLRALGEPARLILHYAKQPFDDVRITHADWPKLKPSTPFGQVPVLEVDGKPLAQSFAIYRYLARQFGKGSPKHDTE
jgi:glutathione S-transferase